MELDKKLAEWAGFHNVYFRDGETYGYDKNEALLWLQFTSSLDACFKHLVPMAIDKICQLFKVDINEAYRTLFQWWRDEGKETEVNALALCEAISKLIDGEK